MRPQQKSNRNRGKNNRKPTGNVVNRVFDSAGPEGKVRGTPQQIIEKYETLARDAQTSGDRVMAENFLQHAEHYARMLSAAQQEREAQQRRENPPDQQQPDPPQQSPREQFSEQGPKSGNGSGLRTIDPSEMEQPDLVVATPEGRPSANEGGNTAPRQRSRRPRPPRKPQGEPRDEAAKPDGGPDEAPAS